MNGHRLVVWIPGVAAPAGSKQGFPIKRPNGKIGVVLTDMSGARGKRWRSDVANAGAQSMRSLGGDTAWLAGALSIVVHLYMPRPRSHFGSGKNADRLRETAPRRPTAKPDATKLLRAIEDAMTGVIWRDDAQIVGQVVEKWYADRPNVPGAVLIVREASFRDAPLQGELVEASR